jgi:hypothetical protein
VAFVSVTIEADQWVQIRHLSQGDDFIDTIFTILHKDLCLTKKSARCVPQLLTKEKKHERVRIRKECFLATLTQQNSHKLTSFSYQR